MTLLPRARSAEIVTDRLRMRDLESRPDRRRPSGLGARHRRQRDRQLVGLEMVAPGAAWHIPGRPRPKAFPPQPMVGWEVLAQHADAVKRRSAMFVDLLALVVQR